MKLDSETRGPSIATIQQALDSFGASILTTPVWQCRSPKLTEHLGPQGSLYLKLELWQYAGSFKPRAALLGIRALTADERRRGVIAVSAGNHGIAVAYAAKQFGVHAKIVMPKTAPQVRINKCKALGAEVLLVENMQAVFVTGESIQKSEGRALIHPFSGENVAVGTGTLGLEMYRQIGPLDALLTGIGGGGLISGVANAYKQLQPGIKVFGVEPEGAAVMSLSRQAGHPVECVPHSIADSLCAPKTELLPFQLCRQFVDQMVTVSDAALVEAMRFLFNEMKLAVEPAAAAGVAGLFGPLRDQLFNKRVGIIISGTNIDERQYCSLLA